MPRESALDYLRGCERSAVALAEAQHGVISRKQLLALGFTPRMIQKRLESGRLHLLHRGVYALGHRVLSRRGHWMAAVLASGERAVLSHRSAAALWGIRQTDRGRIEVTVPLAKRARPRIQIHRAPLPPDELATHHGIPVTTPSRTAFDLAAVLPEDRMAKVLSELERLRLPNDPVSLHELLDRHPQGRGSKLLRRQLEDLEPTHTRSELEDAFNAFLKTTDLPPPLVNQPLHLQDRVIHPDFFWPEASLIVELDGRGSHDTRAAFETDRARDRAALVAGLRTVRVTWRQLHAERPQLRADLYRLQAR
jgi:very-short-patch-repair endonuclease